MDSKKDESADNRKWLAILVISAAILAFILSLALGSQFLTPVVSFVFSGAVLAAIVAGIFQIASDRTATKRALRQVDLQYKLDSIQSMWKTADHYMREYYYPIATAAQNLSSGISDWKKSGLDSTLMRAFYWFVRFRLSTVEMLKKTQFFILSNYLAEQCAWLLHSRIHAAPNLGPLELSLLSKTLKPDFAFYQLSEKIQRDKQTRATYYHFKNWVKSKVDEVDTLVKDGDYFNALITVEINRMYEQWYGTPYKAPPGKSLDEIAKYLNLP